MTLNMTKGNPAKLILTFAVPMLIGNIFQQVYSLVDTVIVGKYLGADALAGVGSTGTVTTLMFCLFFGLTNGAGILIAQCYGASNYSQLKKAVTAMIYIALALTLTLIVFGRLFVRILLLILAIPDGVVGYSSSYLNIMITFVAGNVTYNVASAVLRNVGDSKTPLYALIAASIINIILDLVFILNFGLGIAGAAFATVISQCISAAICVIHLYRKRMEIHIDGLPKLPEKQIIFLIIKTGLPAAFQSCAISLGGLSVQRLINSYGEAAMAAYAAAVKLDTVAIQVIVTIGTSMSVFTGQNMGSRDYDRIRMGLRSTLLLRMISSVSIAVFVLCFKGHAMRLFLDAATEQKAIAIGEVYLSIIGIAYVIAGIMQSYQNLIRGAGDVNICMVAGLVELSARILFAYLLSPLIGVTGIWLATPISWGCGCVIPVIRYYTGKWKEKALVEKEPAI